ncbi:hypothetical protein K2173_006488 [Erythroxylum novogranatense]|uniref:Uncharacterized protein n=1 Tax=Erythroxylum novogranatense TaxID=1862640 RepID=A0AAV8SL10_9ROSI|nr:hypothetical protein K2173_006488 [Erythroxylum novogranatense]
MRKESSTTHHLVESVLARRCCLADPIVGVIPPRPCTTTYLGLSKGRLVDKDRRGIRMLNWSLLGLLEYVSLLNGGRIGVRLLSWSEGGAAFWQPRCGVVLGDTRIVRLSDCGIYIRVVDPHSRASPDSIMRKESSTTHPLAESVLARGCCLADPIVGVISPCPCTTTYLGVSKGRLVDKDRRGIRMLNWSLLGLLEYGSLLNDGRIGVRLLSWSEGGAAFWQTRCGVVLGDTRIVRLSDCGIYIRVADPHSRASPDSIMRKESSTMHPLAESARALVLFGRSDRGVIPAACAP